jgi:hypothetical protein
MVETAPMVLAQHLGALHPLETLAMAALTLGPFVVLAVVVAVVSRRDRRAESAGQATRDEPAREPGREGSSGSTTTDTAAPQSVQQ